MPGRVGTRQGEYFSQALCGVLSRALLPESRGFVPAVFGYLEAGAALAADPRADVQPAAPQPCCSCRRAPQGSRNISTRCPVGTEPLAASELHLRGHLSLAGVGKPRHLCTQQQPSWGCGWEGLLPPAPWDPQLVPPWCQPACPKPPQVLAVAHRGGRCEGTWEPCKDACFSPPARCPSLPRGCPCSPSPLAPAPLASPLL